MAVFVAILLFAADPAALSGAATDAHLDLGLSRDVLAQQIAWQGDDGSLFVTEPYGWYRLVTSGFLHFGLIHIGLNMFFLYVLGPMLEPALGRVRFLLLYMAALLGGSLGVVLLDKGGISAGASGAVFGLMAAAAVGQWRRGINPMTTGHRRHAAAQLRDHVRHPGDLDRGPPGRGGRRRDLRGRDAGPGIPGRAQVGHLRHADRRGTRQRGRRRGDRRLTCG